MSADPTDRAVVAVLPAGTMQGVGIERHLDVAAATGHDAVSLRPRHLWEWQAEGTDRTLEGLARRLGALGLGVSELDPVAGWSDPARWPGGRLPDEQRAELDAAAVLGAAAVTALVLPGEPWAPGPGTAGLAVLVEEATARGVAVQVEPFGWSPLGSVPAAVAAVRAVGAPGLGLMVDTWHLVRAGGGVATVEALAPAEVLGLQVADGPARPALADPADDNRVGRVWPGEGEQRPERVLASLLDRGWAGPVAVEVFGDASADPEGRARSARRALDGMLATIGR